MFCEFSDGYEGVTPEICLEEATKFFIHVYSASSRSVIVNAEMEPSSRAMCEKHGERFCDDAFWKEVNRENYVIWNVLED